MCTAVDQAEAETPARKAHFPGSIGFLEQQAGVIDRVEFWMPFAKFEDGFQRGVAKLKSMIAESAGRASA